MIVDRLLSGSNAWSTWIVAVTWQLAVLAVVAWVIERVFRVRQPGARYGLWWFVLVAPLVLGPVRMGLEQRQAVVRVAPPAAVQLVSRVGVPMVAPVARAVHQADGTGAATPVSWWSQVDRGDVLIVMWAVGCLLLVARLVVGHMRARRLIEEGRAVTDREVLDTLSELRAEAGVRRKVGLRVSASVGAPVLYGVRRPIILLPEEWVEGFGSEGVRALLAHEVAHVKRGDCLANLVQRLCEIPAFFHPGVWLASRNIALAREELADRWALSRGADAGSYARSLAAMAERARVGLGAASVGVAEGKSTLLKRVEAIMRGASLKRMSRPLIAALIGAALVSAVAFAAVQVTGNSLAPDKEEVPLTAAASKDLTAADTEAALAAAGVQMQRYDYEVGFPHTIVFTFERYVGGKLADTGSQGGLSSREAGKQSFVLTIRRQGEKTIGDGGLQDTRTLSFWLSNKEGSFGGAPVYTFEGYEGEAYGPMRARLALDQKVPIYHVVTNLAKRGGISGSSNFDTVADLASHYDMAIIVYAELKREA